MNEENLGKIPLLRIGDDEHAGLVKNGLEHLSEWDLDLYKEP